MSTPKTPMFRAPPARDDTIVDTTKKHGIIIPRVGGVITLDETKGYGEAFTGGSNITPSLPISQFGLQRRPNKFSSVESFTTTLEKGLELKLSSPNERKNPTSLVAWFKELSKKLELFGLDTVFKVPNNTWTEEIYIAKDWGKAKSSLVDPWV